MDITIKDKETGFLLCPECYSTERVTFHEVFVYCSCCGLELVTPYPNTSKKHFDLIQQDKERYKRFLEYLKTTS